MVGSEAVQAAISQTVLFSRSLLRCAALREVIPHSCCPLTGLTQSPEQACFAFLGKEQPFKLVQRLLGDCGMS